MAKNIKIKKQNAGRNRVSIRVASSPESSWPNPYIDLFYKAISKYNIKLIGKCPLNNKLLRENARHIDAIHLHWPEELWRYAKDLRLGKLRGLFGFLLYLRIAHKHKIAIVWTVHNMEHHEGIDAFDKMAYYVLAKRSDLLICHSQNTKEKIVERWHPRNKIIVMYHGNYDGIYPEPSPKNQIIKELGLDPNIPIVCCIGAIRDYKGIDVAIKAAKRMGRKIQLIIAGKPLKEYNIDSLVKSCDNCDWIRIIPKSLSSQEFADIHNVSDAVLLPYRKITGSGAFLSAMTLGRGVIASDLSYFREMLADNTDAGYFFETNNEIALADAIEEYLKIPAMRRQAAARKVAQIYSWDKVVEQVGPALRECVVYKH